MTTTTKPEPKYAPPYVWKPQVDSVVSLMLELPDAEGRQVLTRYRGRVTKVHDDDCVDVVVTGLRGGRPLPPDFVPPTFTSCMRAKHGVPMPVWRPFVKPAIQNNLEREGDGWEERRRAEHLARRPV